MNTYKFEGFNQQGLDYILVTCDKSKIIELQNQYTGNGNHFITWNYSLHLNQIKPEWFDGVKFN